MKCTTCDKRRSPKAKNPRGQCTKCSEKYHDAKRRKDPKRQEYMRELQKKRGSLERIKAWAKADPARLKAVYKVKSARRRLADTFATPFWSDLETIKKIYANCPEGYHVDHIVPIKGKNVCGLHVPDNLQYLPAIENLKKGNKFNGR